MGAFGARRLFDSSDLRQHAATFLTGRFGRPRGSRSAAAQLRIEISGVGANQIPLAFIPMNGTAETGIDPFKVVSADLNRTGAFRIMEADREATLEESVRPSLSPWSDKGAAMLAVGSVIRQADGTASPTASTRL